MILSFLRWLTGFEQDVLGRPCSAGWRERQLTRPRRTHEDAIRDLPPLPPTRRTRATTTEAI